MLAYLNGRFLPFAEATLPLHDAGFVFGATIVDNARTFRHRLFRWKDHLIRLRRDCWICAVPLEATDDQLTAIADELICHNASLLPPGGELQLVTFATPGPLGSYLGETTNGPPTLGMVTYPLPIARFRRFFTEGVTLALAGFQSWHPEDMVPRMVKHRNRLNWYRAEQVVGNPENPEYRAGGIPVLLDQSGEGGDTAIGGILAVADGAVIRPPRQTVLDSISLTVVSELCRGLGIPFREARYNMAHLGHSELVPPNELAARVTEVMLTGTGFCLAGVREFCMQGVISRTYPWPGPTFRKLLTAWSDLVGVDIERQFTGVE